MTISVPEHDSAEEVAPHEDELEDDEEEENLTGRTWTTLIMFAAFVVLTSGCMINLLLR